MTRQPILTTCHIAPPPGVVKAQQSRPMPGAAGRQERLA